MSAPTPPLRELARALADVVGVAERLAFWAGIALPCVHLPLLALRGFSPETMPLLAALWTIHGVALLAGRGHLSDGPNR
ncbi:hypothetical protein ACFQMA_17690 [Halosimplex aquaticum]|uniref:Uncharacterized protein n=1 Tax=Halosimplex aquaticum TaxID=3026162 RepID=A0ABD5Y7H5_9EURY|nr:hypothetical protein [Halosimplex aquaticum]